jgi:hypothetical protein
LPSRQNNDTIIWVCESPSRLTEPGYGPTYSPPYCALLSPNVKIVLLALSVVLSASTPQTQIPTETEQSLRVPSDNFIYVV